MPNLPTIDITFKTLASTVVSRSERGEVILILSGLVSMEGYKEYTSLAQVDADELASYGDTEGMYRKISNVFRSAVAKVILYVVEEGQSIQNVLTDITINHKPCWIYTDAEHQTELISFVKEQEAKKKYYKAVVCGASAPNCKHIVNIGNNGKVIIDTLDEEQPASAVTTIVLGALASANVKRGVTGAIVPGIVKVVGETLDEQTAVESGRLLLVNARNGVKISVGINSSTDSNPDDMRYIENVEVTDMISDDITTLFEEEYQGKTKNSLDNQMLFIASVNGYFAELENEEILDNEYENKVEIDVEAQRRAWIAAGTAEAASWSDDIVRARSFKRTMFLAGDIKILNTVDSLKFAVALA